MSANVAITSPGDGPASSTIATFPRAFSSSRINVNISTNLLNKNCPNIANNVEVKILENNDNFTEQDWKSLYQLSEKTFVEETESLKKGAAGAGLTDND